MKTFCKAKSSTGAQLDMGLRPLFGIFTITTAVAFVSTAMPASSQLVTPPVPPPVAPPIGPMVPPVLPPMPVPVKPPSYSLIKPPVISGLSIQKSLLTGVIDTRTMTASYYWNITLHNSGRRSQEAQMYISMPENSTVSRATLWINGQPQEAAFNETSRVTNAYEWITKRNRDPLLVTQAAPGLIQAKAAPVLAGQNMQLRIGITSAAKFADGKLHYSLPAMVASNLEQIAQTDLSLQSNDKLGTTDASLGAVKKGKEYVLRGNVIRMPEKLLVVSASASKLTKHVALRATHAYPEAFIVGKLTADKGGVSKMVFTKTLEVPAGATKLDDEHAAHRASTLWSYTEAEHLRKRGFLTEAGALAETYRFVSSVSGATVLEMDSDYQYHGLHRDRYRTLSYMPGDAEKAAEQRAQFAPAPTPTPGPVPENGPLNKIMDFLGQVNPAKEERKLQMASVERSSVSSNLELKGAIGGTIAPAPSAAPAPLEPAAFDPNVPTTRAKRQASDDIASLAPAQPVFHRERALATGDKPMSELAQADTVAPMLPPSAAVVSAGWMALLAVALLAGLTFTGPVLAVFVAAMGALRKRPEALAAFVVASVWVALAIYCPFASQLALGAFVIGKLLQRRTA